MQTKTKSLLESLTNTFSGFLVSYILLLFINQIYSLSLTLWASFEVTCIFTLASIGRNYIIRRLFNKKEKR